MSFTIILKHVPSGEEREIHEDGLWDDIADYMWTEGNYSCDCNRALFFYNCGPESDDRACGDSEFMLPRVVLADGTVLEVEESNTPQ
jgi:hypothetical protein